MSYDYLSRENKQQNHPKVYFGQYLRSYDEPVDYIGHDSPPDEEASLPGNSHDMRLGFRRIARILRDR